MLRRLVPEGYLVESFTYTQADFSKARQEILGYIREHGIDLVVGSSLGGFIVLTLNGIPRIVVNPCWYPGEVLPLIDVPHEIVHTYAPPTTIGYRSTSQRRTAPWCMPSLATATNSLARST